MNAPLEPALHFLWHPESLDTFSGYGLLVAPRHVVGLLMIDRPERASPEWLEVIERVFGGYEITEITATGERGIVCQMMIAPDSIQHLRSLPDPRASAIRDALVPLLKQLPKVTLAIAWHPDTRSWVSQIVQRNVPLFSLGQIVATPGALDALEEAGQLPAEFLNRHVRGDWGDVPEEDKQENELSVEQGFRILSAYTTSAGERIWVLTEADRSYTTLLLPSEY